MIRRAAVEGALDRLPKLERYIVENVHAVYGGHRKEPTTVGLRLGMSPVRAVAVYQQAIGKLRQQLGFATPTNWS